MNELRQQRTSNTELRTSKSGKGRAYDLEERLLKFSVAVIDLSEALPKTRAGNHVAGQVLRSGTAPCAIHGEAESAESADDFVHKLKLCLKELRETRRWLRLIAIKTWSPNQRDLEFALGEVEELIRIFVSSIRTAQRNRLAGSHPDLDEFDVRR